MNKKSLRKICFYSVIGLLYFLAVSVIREGNVLSLIAGGVIGILFLELEHPLARLLAQPHNRPILHNIFFQGVVMILSFYIVGFFPGDFSFGLVMGIFLHLLLDVTGDYFDEKKFLTWFWISKEETSRLTQRIYFTLILFIFIYFTILFVGRNNF